MTLKTKSVNKFVSNTSVKNHRLLDLDTYREVGVLSDTILMAAFTTASLTSVGKWRVPLTPSLSIILAKRRHASARIKRFPCLEIHK